MQLLAAAGSLLVLALGGCSALQRPIPSRSQMVGTWTHGDAALTFRSDGSCSVARLPRYAVGGDTPSTANRATLTDGCTWRIGDEHGDVRSTAGFPLLFVRFDDPAAVQMAGFELQTEGSGRSMRLFQPLGDPDSGAEYALAKTSAER